MAGFDGVSAQAYRQFMGRFSTPLASAFATVGLAGVDVDARVLDVGCGPGMLTIELASGRRPELVSAIDPQAEFVAATSAVCPGVDVRVASAEKIPFADGRFGAALAQLVVHFMTDPVRGVSEMGRVVAPGGRVSACVWDHGAGRGPLSGFWRVAARLDEQVQGESSLTGANRGELGELFAQIGLSAVREEELEVEVAFTDFDDWWQPFLGGVGPAGRYVATLDPNGVERLELALREELGEGAFALKARAWTATGTTL